MPRFITFPKCSAPLCSYIHFYKGWNGILFPKKSPRIRLVPLFRGRKCPFRGSELNGIPREKKIRLHNSHNLHRIESMFSSANCFRTKFQKFASIFVARNGPPSCFFLLRKGLDWNFESLLLLFFQGTEFRAFFYIAKWFGAEFQEFSAGSEQTICFVYFVLFFCRKFPTLIFTD